MIFVVRTAGGRPADPDVRIVLVRRTPAIVPDGAGLTDLFCVGDEAAPDRLRDQGWTVVSLHDGWYQADDEDGVAVWGHGLYWEVRDTPFSIKEAAGPVGDQPGGQDDDEVVDVRRGIFGV